MFLDINFGCWNYILLMSHDTFAFNETINLTAKTLCLSKQFNFMQNIIIYDQ